MYNIDNENHKMSFQGKNVKSESEIIKETKSEPKQDLRPRKLNKNHTRTKSYASAYSQK